MPDTPEPPAPMERGRYAIFQAPDGGWVVARAVDTCEVCQTCGCGTQAEPIMIPAMVIKMAMMRDASMVKKLRAMVGARSAMADPDGELADVAEGWTDGTETP